MVTVRMHDGEGRDRVPRKLPKVAGLAFGIALFGTVGLSGTLAQADDVTVGAADAESIIAEIFAEIFGGGVGVDDAAVSGGAINVGGNTGGSVTMGGSSGGGITIGGSGGGVTVGDESGG